MGKIRLQSEVDAIQLLKQAGKSLEEISDITKVSRISVWRIAKGLHTQTWDGIFSDFDLNEGEFGYLAGLLDHSGVLNIYSHKNKTGKYYSPCIRFIGTNVEQMDYLQSIFGGKYHLSEGKSGRGGVPIFTLNVTGYISIYSLLRRLLPYLIIKKGNAMRVMQFIEERVDINGSSWRNDLQQNSGISK